MQRRQTFRFDFLTEQLIDSQYDQDEDASTMGESIEMQDLSYSDTANDDVDEALFLKSIYQQADTWIESVSKNASNKKFAPYIDKLHEFQRNLRFLMRLLQKQRYPRLAVVSRRGAGKSSLINALLGQRVAEPGHVKAQTGKAKLLQYRVDDDQGFDIIDTRGFFDNDARPAEEDTVDNAIDSVVNALTICPVDAILLLHKIKEVDVSIEPDLAALLEILKRARLYQSKIPLIVVLTHADEIEPSDIKKPEDYDQEKLDNIDLAKQVFLKNFHQYSPQLSSLIVGCVAVSSAIIWQAPNDDGNVLPHPKRDYRYNMDALLDLLLRNVQIQALFKTVQASRTSQVKKDFAVFLIKIFASMAAVISLVPIPTSDMIPLTALTSYLVYTISKLGSGRRPNIQSSKDSTPPPNSIERSASLQNFLTVIGFSSVAALTARYFLSQMLKLMFIPGVSSGGSAVISYSMVTAIGHSAVAYFLEGKSDQEVKNIFDNVQSESQQDEEVVQLTSLSETSNQNCDQQNE
ncbi:hypothetical protein MP228_001615 [Amoeboaphelidium protococcarum]|nr:hypothetical protein MP228_001615 [Amoeboaphelidium protococcarum]